MGANVRLSEEEFYNQDWAKRTWGDYSTYLKEEYGISPSQDLTIDNLKKDKFTNPSARGTSSTIIPPATAEKENGVEGGYTMDDVVEVVNGGKKQEEKPTSAYDTYMGEALKLYNQGVEKNNQNAANQAAAAGAQYREVERNINELNKANGTANTGYAGDTNIDAYNAYRNSVNASYANADSANNDLYAYYLDSVNKIQQAKDAKEAQDRTLAMEEQAYADNKATNVLYEVDNILSQEGAYNADGTINSETGNKIMDYLNAVYEGEIPSDVLARIETVNGFKDWVNVYNEGSDKGYIEEHENPLKTYSLPTEEGYRGANNTQGKVNVQGFGNTDRPRNDIDLSIGGVEYDLRMGDKADSKSAKVLDDMLRQSRTQKAPKMTAVYNGYIYIVDHSGNWRQMWGDENTVNEAVEAYIKAYQGK